MRLLRVIALSALALIGALALSVWMSGLSNGSRAYASAELGPMVLARGHARPVPIAVATPKSVASPRRVAVPVAHHALVHKSVRVVRAVKAARVVRAAPATTTDAYPYRTSQVNAPDAWGFTQRQCVSYVAWRLARAGAPISQNRDAWGSASSWDDTARRLGFAVNNRPSIGAVAQWEPGESSSVWSGQSKGTFTAGAYGHVAYVTGVYPDGSVQVAQYNVTGSRTFSTMRMTAPRFLHIT